MDQRGLSDMPFALKITVTGRVQGVGFRPFIYSLAKKYGLKGTVQNNLDGLLIHVEGDKSRLRNLADEVRHSPPRLAKVANITIQEAAPSGLDEFRIVPSENEGEAVPWLPADAAVCELCTAEMNDPADGRHNFPFINCTQCGPRYTIIQGLPYDRPLTAMKDFPMCLSCKEEYEDPGNRRHHAQPVCCPACGPRLSLINHAGQRLSENAHAISQTIEFLKKGKITAIKGIGGYHLACDPFQTPAVARLRQLKRRPQRPFAVMVKSVEAAREFCSITKNEEQLLSSLEMPIVILRRKVGCSLPNILSPGLSTLGVMLPYTPLHHLLLSGDLPCLVMTSANTSGLPISYRDDSQSDLNNLCDYLLTHNRPIERPVDDSVVQWDGEEIIFLRRARGYVPEPVTSKLNVNNILAIGGDQKNTFAIGKEHYIYLSPHIGDVESEEMIHSLEDTLCHYKNWLQSEPECIAFDKHPLYETASLEKKLPGIKVPVQHHHAHHVSCMEDNSLVEPCLGIILDGTGYGEDGHIWGFEFLYGNADSVERLGHLSYTPLPGGEKAVREPWRTAAGMLLHYWPEEGRKLAADLFPEQTGDLDVISRMVANGINSPLAGTCGRLFDAVSAILGICTISTYEGEAAVKLADVIDGTAVTDHEEETYPFRLITSQGHGHLLDFSAMIYEIIQEKKQGLATRNIIHKFHQTIVSSSVQTILSVIAERPELNRTVVLSGGSFQNNYLRKEVKRQLRKKGFTVFTHKQIPCHDGGLSLGQLTIAAQAIKSLSHKKRGDKRCV
ncbi:carbamoyltransferase HypF [Salipaludibacillus sp. CUR1]|uniref:carbamoyltransferase HypF n=1 Tax=Salipaludibacillus sp. CUR1 TaxID=2820003 RepID=UPI00351CFAEE